MSRYIDADKARDNSTDPYVRIYLDSQPTADVAPVVHGHWEYHECVCTDEGMTGVYVCSACKAAVQEAVFDFLMDGFYKDFCGACGALMDEEVKEDEDE